VRATSDRAFRDLLARFCVFYRERLFNPHWGEQVHIGPGNVFEISMACQGLAAEAVAGTWHEFHDWIRAAPRDYEIVEPLGARPQLARAAWSVAGNGAFERDLRPGAPAHHGWSKGDQGEVGAFLHGYDSVWLPASLLRTPGVLAEGMFAASRFQMVRLFCNKGLAGAAPEVIAGALDTATNPQVAGAFALAIIADGQGPAYPGQPGAKVDLAAARLNARAIDAATAALRRIAPGAGSYVSESNYFNANWQRDFWGANYPRLLAVKRRYDPTGLFFVRHGVGSEDWSEDGFDRA
jgi:FAD/FMN-containing dehydrogenase